MKHLWIIIILATIGGFSACKKSSTGSKTPQISLIKVTPNTIRMASTDTISISFNIADGDADLGNDPDGTLYDIYMVDSRYKGGPDVSEDTIALRFPEIPKGAQNPAKGVEGICVLDLDGGYFYVRDDHPEGDTLQFDIYVIDKALHKSNLINTGDIYITP
jgi:hypothetical protein